MCKKPKNDGSIERTLYAEDFNYELLENKLAGYPVHIGALLNSNKLQLRNRTSYCGAEITLHNVEGEFTFKTSNAYVHEYLKADGYYLDRADILDNGKVICAYRRTIMR